MLAVLMAGGEGSRLRPWTHILPKPLLPVRGRAVADWTLMALGRTGVRRVTVTVRPEDGVIACYLSGRHPAGLQIQFHEERQPLGTAGCLREVGPLSDPFLVINGDVLFTADLTSLVAEHVRARAAATVASRTLRSPVPYGVLIARGARVTGLEEKPVREDTVAAGIYALSPRALDHLPPGRCDMPDLIRCLVRAGEHVRIHPLPGYWADIGSPQQYEQAVRDFPGLPDTREV